MTRKRQILDALPRAQLQALVAEHDLEVADRRVRCEQVDALARSKRERAREVTLRGIAQRATAPAPRAGPRRQRARKGLADRPAGSGRERGGSCSDEACPRDHHADQRRYRRTAIGRGACYALLSRPELQAAVPAFEVEVADRRVRA